MRARWDGLHAAFVHSVVTLQADRDFRIAQEDEPALARFATPRSLIEFLTCTNGEDPDEKDRIYAALVRGSQTRSPWAALAMAVLWCGLWPALDVTYRRRLRQFEDPDELVEAISVAFTLLVAWLDLSRVHRVAATLARSTDREVLRGRRREWKRRARARQHEEAASAAPEVQTEPRRESELGLPVGPTFEAELEALRAWLVPISGADTELLIAVVVLDETQRAAADRLGLNHAYARKRHERALERLRAHFAKKVVTVRRPKWRF